MCVYKLTDVFYNGSVVQKHMFSPTENTPLGLGEGWNLVRA